MVRVLYIEFIFKKKRVQKTENLHKKANSTVVMRTNFHRLLGTHAPLINISLECGEGHHPRVGGSITQWMSE